MTIQEKIQEDIKESMRVKDALRLDVLRGMKSAIKHKEIEKIRTLEESEVHQVLHTLVKQRKDSIDQFKKGGRADLVAREEDELKILESYLPAAVSGEEIQKVVSQSIAELQATNPKDLGRVMKAVMAKLAGRIVDGKLVSEQARAQLGG
ncbi:MAG: GatB/YqeY domain-containing protein [Acidimicrobiia bacterium]|nr:GatB/YqeY domain-containing protein [Acidimicrobiia bacterium]